MKTYIATRDENGCSVEVQHEGRTYPLQSERPIDWGHDAGLGSRERLAWLLIADAFEGKVEEPGALASSTSLAVSRLLLMGLPEEGWTITEDQVQDALRRLDENGKKTATEEDRWFSGEGPSR